MKLKGTYSIAAEPGTVYERITDPGVLQKCIQGCEKMVKTSDNNYDVHLKLGVAGLKGSYTGQVELKDQNPPDSYTLIVQGKGAPGFVKGTAKINLVGNEGQTELTCDADAQVGGLIASIGSRLIGVTAKKMMDQFFKKFSEEVK